MSAAPRVRFGIAGWSYPDWQDVVYPRRCRDTLRWVAGHVDVVEVNSSFYAIPSARTVRSWHERTVTLPVEFTAKRHQDFTHRGRVEPASVEAFHAAFAPLREAGRLRAVLAQFSHRFTATPGSRAHLRTLVESFAGLAPVVVEVRHTSWQEPAVLEELAALGVSLACLDHPEGRESFTMASSGVFGLGAGRMAYLRLHGRNRAAWFSKDAGRDATYDWLYAESEVDEIARRALALAREAGETLVVANNHFHGKAMKVVLELVARITGQQVDVPPPLLRAYPELERIARAAPRQGELFGG